MKMRYRKDARPIGWLRCIKGVMIQYEDGDAVTVSDEDFNRAFGTIINITKAQCKHDFAM